MLLMMLVVTLDVLLRNLINRPFPNTFEVSELSMVGVVFLGIALTQRQKGHVAIEMATNWLPERARRLLEGAGCLVGVALMAIVTWRAALQAWEAYVIGDYMGAVVRLPVWPSWSLVVLGTAVLAIRLLLDLTEHVAGALGRP